MGPAMLEGFFTFGLLGLEGLVLCDDCGRGLEPTNVLALSLPPFPVGAAIDPLSAPSEL
jgi:hypothetical protein